MGTTSTARLMRTGASIALMSFGLLFMTLAYGYGLGTPLDLGPGFFPFLFAGLMVAMLAGDLVTSARSPDSDPIDTVSGRRLILVCASLASFGLLLGVAGFVPAVLVATFLARRAEQGVSWWVSVLYTAGLTAGSYLLFIRLLGIPVTAFG